MTSLMYIVYFVFYCVDITCILCYCIGLTTHWDSHEIVYLTQKHKHMIKFEGIQTKSSSLGAPNEDGGRKITINDKHHLIGQ